MVYLSASIFPTSFGFLVGGLTFAKVAVRMKTTRNLLDNIINIFDLVAAVLGIGMVEGSSCFELESLGKRK